jgi:hypothetical protein
MDVSGLVQPFFFRQTNNMVMCAGGAGVTGAMGPFLVRNIYRLKNNCKQQNLREKIGKEKIFCVGKVRIRFDFSLHGNGNGRRKCPRCKPHTNSVNTVRLGLDGCVQVNVGLWPGVGAGTTYHNITTSQHGKRREIRGKTQKMSLRAADEP